jgi:hypothetical protein
MAHITLEHLLVSQEQLCNTVVKSITEHLQSNIVKSLNCSASYVHSPSNHNASDVSKDKRNAHLGLHLSRAVCRLVELGISINVSNADSVAARVSATHLYVSICQVFFQYW